MEKLEADETHQRRNSKIGFTELVYSIVIGFTLFRINTNLQTLNIFMLIFSFMIIIDDWIEYHYFIDLAGKISTGKKMVILVLDFIFLILWYFTTIIPSQQFSNYILMLSILFLVSTLWMAYLYYIDNVTKMFKDTDLILFIYFLFAFFITFVLRISILIYVILALSYLIFILSRIKIWKAISKVDLEI